MVKSSAETMSEKTEIEFGSDNVCQKRNYCLRNCRQPLVIETPFGVTLRGKGQLRAAVQALAFGALILGCSAYHAYSTAFSEDDFSFDSDDELMRLLQDASNATNLDQSIPGESLVACDDLKKADSWWMTVFYIIGILYMFLALAIICDEFFVPALEELSGPRRLNMSMDVAGKSIRICIY